MICNNHPQEKSRWDARIPSTHLLPLPIPSGFPIPPFRPPATQGVFVEGLSQATMELLTTSARWGSPNLGTGPDQERRWLAHLAAETGPGVHVA